MPSASNNSFVFLPTPIISPTGSGHNFSGTSLFLSTVIPKGFFISDAILAKNLLGAIPILHGKCNCCNKSF